MKAIFWNLQGASFSNECVHALAQTERPQLFALAEHIRFDGDDPPLGYQYQRLSPRLALLTVTSPTTFPPKDRRLRKFVQVVELNGWLIAVCHLKSVLNDGVAERNSLLRKLKVFLKDNFAWQNLLVLGDLNANPWDPGIVDKESLYGLQSRAEAITGLNYDGEFFPALINESYQLARTFATGTGEVWGTYRHKEDILHSSLRWHILDQALVSADAKATVSVRTELPNLPWYQGLGLSSKTPDYPDHLPIIVELEKI